MIGVDKLVVSINLAGIEVDLGELASSGRKIYFKYHSSFIDRGIEISPFKMPLSEGILEVEHLPFDGLFGVFNDSLPDGWGRLLLDRTLFSRGISPTQITPLDRLSYVGTRGMGALIYRPEISSSFEHENALELDYLAEQMSHVLEGTSDEVLEELFDLGGSSGGARPKVFVGYNPETNQLVHGKEKLPEGFEHWIIKFSSSSDPSDMANIEYAYHKMALDTGIEMNPCRLFEGKSGKQYFGTKRFDRVGGNRVHMHSGSGLMHDNFRLSTMDYGNLMDCAFKLENHVGAYDKILRLAAFNVFSYNRDDHSKNFSFLMDEKGEWQVAPAYDLTFSSSSHGFHSTMVAGESKRPGKKHLFELAEYFGMKKPNQVIEKVRDVILKWNIYAQDYGVGATSTNLIAKTIG
ncbi:MAG: serine/threonine-protein kinase HipA [Cyclobacteriaceae bacterium]|jgi:serine/threonine-protein kinase HipA